MEERDGRLTPAEAVAGSALAACAAAIVIPYGIGRLGGTIAPWPVLIVSVAVAAAALDWLLRDAASERDLLPFVLLAAGVFAALLSLAWPALLPIGGGSDLAHHLQLVDFIERHWRLPLDPLAERQLGGMVSYTPGMHILAALVGRWIGRDGLHAVYSILALSAAIKAAIVFLIARRVLAVDRLRTPAAAVAALLLFLPFDYFAGSFVRASFFAQALSEMFAVGMWWALVVCDERPSAPAAAIFGLAGMGVFLTWPVWIGPPMLVLIAVLWMRRPAAGVRDAALASSPIAVVAAAHAFGRVSSTAIVQTGGSTFWPTVSRFSWPFLLLAAIGLSIALRQRRMRVGLLLLAAFALQATVLFALAVRHGSATAYMALKMVHLAVYPMAVAGALAIAAICRWLTSIALRARTARSAPNDRAAYACRAVIVVLMIHIVRVAAAGPPQAVVISEDLFLAGQWARAHVPPACVEYLVPQDATAYWLHHAVLGNPSYSPPGAPPPVFSYRDAVVRWITRTSYPFAIADLRVVPREVREEMDERARFGDVIVGSRRGTAAPACPGIF